MFIFIYVIKSALWNPVLISRSVNPLMVLMRIKIPNVFTLRNGNNKHTLCAWRCAPCSQRMHTCKKTVVYSAQMLSQPPCTLQKENFWRTSEVSI